MKIIVGLGNPERDYKGTRHNIGFETIDKLAYDYNITVKKEKFRSVIGSGIIQGQKVTLVKPQTFMNLSGEAVIEVLNFHSLGAEDLIVVYDDADLPLATIRLRTKGSAGGHNGIKNILYHLNTDEFMRIKIGIGEKPKEYDLADYVLGRFRKEEHEDMVKGVTLATDALAMLLKDGEQKAMEKFNRKAPKEEQV